LICGVFLLTLNWEAERMIQFRDISDIKEVICQDNFLILLFSSSNCNVCISVKENIQHLINKYPYLNFYQVPIDELPAASGDFLVFTIPTIVLFHHGKEVYRASRFIPFKELEDKILLYNENL